MLPWLELGGRLPGLTLECTAPQKMNHCGIREMCLLNKQRTALEPKYCERAVAAYSFLSPDTLSRTLPGDTL